MLISPLQLYVHELVQQLYHLQVHHIRDETESSDDNYRQWTEAIQKSHSSFPEDTGKESIKKSADEISGNHSNLSPLLAVLESRHAFFFIHPYLRFTLFDVAMHSPAMLEDSVAKPLFVLYQLLSLLNHCHHKGVTLGDINLKNVFMDARLWVQIRLLPDMFQSPLSSFTGTQDNAANEERQKDVEVKEPEDSNLKESLEDSCESTGTSVTPSTLSSLGSLSDLKAGSMATLMGAAVEDPKSRNPYMPPSLHLSEATQKWRNGELSNFDYLMLLNYHAGRVMGDPNNHPIFPWVMEFTHKDGGYRDLTKSKYRLNKGDGQLDFTYVSAQEEQRREQDQSLVPHHIGDISSDVTYYVYLARKTPKDVLCSHVRPQWVPKEYPSSIEKMYVWTPDECIPEFFTDPSIFKSIHPDLPDLAVPEWACSPEELVSIHRNVLEGDVVSAQLHHWIDLIFGYKLTGHDAVRAKNVYVSLVDKHKEPKNCGIVQLFKSSHPKRITTTSAPFAINAWNSYLNMSSVVNASVFPINQPLPNPQGSNASSQRLARLSSPEYNDKTLESIINEQSCQQNSSGDAATLDPIGQDSHEDEFNGSFEHVNIDDVKEKDMTTNVSSGLPNGDVGINYDETPTIPTNDPKIVQSLSKPRGESVVVPRFRVPVVNIIFRQRNKGHNVDTEGSYEWQQQEVSLPKDANILHRLNKLEEMSNFAFKSCKSDGGLYDKQWEPESLFILDVSYCIIVVQHVHLSQSCHVLST